MKQAILVVSFGSSYPDTVEKCIEATEKKIALAYPEWEVKRAWTSYRIIEKVFKRDGVQIPKPEEALSKLIEEGFERILVQPLHIMPGYEYEKIQRAVAAAGHDHPAVRLELGDTLLFANEDYAQVVEALQEEILLDDERHAWVLMGHGTAHYANAVYSCLQLHMDDQYLPLHVGTVEGYPELEQVIMRLHHCAVSSVTLMPFMLVAGDHARNDMIGEDEGSWKMVLEKHGFEVDAVVKGLGELEAFQQLYVNRVERAMARMDG